MVRRFRPAATPVEPLTREILAALWRAHPDPTSRLLLGEIARLHRVLQIIEQDRQTIQQAWMHEAGGQLAALHHLRRTLLNEPALKSPVCARSAPTAGDDDDQPW